MLGLCHAVWSGWISSLPEKGVEEVLQPVGVRRRQDEAAARGGKIEHRLEERAGRTQVLDDLTGDDRLERADRQVSDTHPILRVDRVGLEAELPCLLDTCSINVEPDQLACDSGNPVVKPPPFRPLGSHLVLVHEAQMDDTAALAGFENRLFA